MNKIIVSKVDFADSEFKSFEFGANDSSLFIYLNSWDNKIIKCVFYEMVQFIYKPGDEVMGLFEIADRSDFLEESLKLIYVDHPSKHNYKLFQLRDIQEFPFIEIVAQTVHVEKITEKD